jgi:transaldolase
MNENNPVRRASALGQSIWYDSIDQNLLQGGELARLIREDGLTGVTTNPAIFEKAIAHGTAYDARLAEHIRHNPHATPRERVEALTCEDVTSAADILRPVYEASGGHDGMVSIELDPDIAHDTEATVNEALRLFCKLSRPNIMIKVPGTREALPAIERLIAAGVNLNVTLLFSVQRYREVAEAYLCGLETRLAQRLPLAKISSVASFFVSRVDSAVDALLDARIADAPESQRENLRSLQGCVAIANAKIAYRQFRSAFGNGRFAPLRAERAQFQRLLWASTGTKNPAYRDVLYMEALIGPHTVNTVPPDTYRAFLDHGKAALTLDGNLEETDAVLEALEGLGIDLEMVASQLENEGLAAFKAAYDRLVAAVADKATHQTLRAAS